MKDLYVKYTGESDSILFNPNRRSLFGNIIQQNLADLLMFDELFARNRFDRIVELGTGSGVFTLWLGLEALCQPAEVFTYDLRDKRSAITTRVAESLPIDFSWRDVLEDLQDEGSRLVFDIRAPGRVLVLCDNGNKPREFELVVPHMKPGDMVGVHDFGVEITNEQIRAILAAEHTRSGAQFFPRAVPEELVFTRSRWRFFLRTSPHPPEMES